MTYSIVAHDPDTGVLGVATATGSVAVGGFVAHAKSGAGAIATQGAFSNWLYGERGLALLESGLNARQVRDELIAWDDGHDQRQLLICDREGDTAAHTGRHNLGHKVHHTDAHIAVAGNMLADKAVISEMQQAYYLSADREENMERRLLSALAAGYHAGGDFRGTHSAALKVSYVDKPPVDLRVDWAETHCIEHLREVYQHTLAPAFQGFLEGVPTRTHPTKTGHISDRSVDE